MIASLLRVFAKLLLALRYRVRVKGLEAVAARGTRGILFLPNHPALVDPFIVMVELHKRFRPRPLADKDQIDRPVIRWMTACVGTRAVPSIATYGRGALAEVRRILAECVEALRQGENIVLYPAGRAYHTCREDLRNSRAVHAILQELPDVRVVLVRQSGLWGSAFSRAGAEPQIGRIVKKAIGWLLLCGIFFAPRRKVGIELHEPDDLPRTGSRSEINRFLEDYYNAEPTFNTYVPHTLWERGGVTRRPELAPAEAEGKAAPRAWKFQPIPIAWFAQHPDNPCLAIPQADTLTDAFLKQARRSPDRIIVADQVRGAKTYRDLVTAILVLKPHVEKLDGDRIGIMLPASVAADILYLTALFAGKTPVMVNWTVGPRNMLHSLDLVGVERVLTAKALITRLKAQGSDFGDLADRFVYLEDVGKRISLPAKLAAWLRSHLSWASLRRADVPATAVILFTSGSEALPKAVPLSHTNLLTNLRDLAHILRLGENDRLLSMLPPFHSFGITVGVLTAVCLGFRTVHHANPTQGATLARLAEAYQATALIGTPTFLRGIVRAATNEQLATVRLFVTGAEKCPDRVTAALAARCPQAVVLEGYGVTECSPIISVNDEAAPRPGTIGKVLPSVEHAIVDPDTGERVPDGGVGVLLVRGPSVFGGYLNYDGKSPFVELDGKPWYDTGDLVSEDAGGVLTFRGRLKRFVKVGGEMVSLPAIEEVLSHLHQSEDDERPTLAVQAADAEGRPEIVLFTTRPLERLEVNQQLREAGLSPIHNIRRVVPIDEIPLLGSGKTDYRALKALLAEGQHP